MAKNITGRLKILLLVLLSIFFVSGLSVVFNTDSGVCYAEEKQQISILQDIKTVTYDKYSVRYEIRGEHSEAGGFNVEYLIGEAYTTTPPVNAGSYDVRITRDEDEQFLPFSTVIKGGLVIEKRKVAITVDDVAENTEGYYYDKTEKSTTATVSGLLNGDSLEYELSYSLNGETTPINAGKWQVLISSATITRGDASNYEIDCSDTGFLCISPKIIGVQWSELTDENLIYDGQEKLLFATALSVLEGDTVNVTVELGADCDNVNAGDFRFVATELDNSNYRLSENAVSPIYTVTPKRIDITVDDVLSGTTGYTYDATEKKTTASHTPLIGSDTLEYKLRYEKDSSFNATSAGEWTVIIDSARITSGRPENYFLDYSDTGVMVIDKAEIIVEIVDVLSGAEGYVYDGASKSTTATHTPLFGNDSIAYELSYELNGDTDGINAGCWQVTIASVSFLSGDGNNYDVDISDVGVMNVAKKPAKIVWQIPESKYLVYSKSAKIINATATDLIEGDECIVTTKLAEGCDNVNAGGFYYRAVSLSNANYYIGENATSDEIIISKKPLKVTANDITVTYGDETVEYGLTFEGFCQGDGIADIDSLPVADSRWTKTTSTIYSGMVINCHGGSDNNYVFEYHSGVLTINKLQIKVFAENKSSIEGEDLKKLTYTTDIQPVFGDSFIGSLSTDADNSRYGVYDIGQGSLYINENYEIIFEKASYCINAKSIESTGGVDAILTTIDGVSPETKFSVEKTELDSVNDGLGKIDGYNTVAHYRMSVSNDEISTERWTVKVKLDGVRSVNDIRIAQVINGETVIQTVRSEGDYIVFNTTEVTDFVVLEKETSVIGVVIVFGIVLLLLAAMYVIYTVKRKRDYDVYRF